MNSNAVSAGAAALVALIVMAGPTGAQDAPPTPADVQPAPVEGSQWRAFSRSASSTFLIDTASVTPQDDAVSVKIARVPLASPPGDYSHMIDDFAVRCAANEAHLAASTEAYEDGELTETFPADEPWAEILRGSFDEGIKQISCGEATPAGAPFPSIRAYIDAGRP